MTWHFAQTTVCVWFTDTASTLLWYDPTFREEVVRTRGSWNGTTFAGGVFRNLAGTGINQNCIAPRSRITSRSCFCTTDALHVSPTWNSFTAPSFRCRGSKIEEQFARNSGAIRKKEKRALYFTIELYPKFSRWARDSYFDVLRTSRGSK